MVGIADDEPQLLIQKKKHTTEKWEVVLVTQNILSQLMNKPQ